VKISFKSKRGGRRNLTDSEVRLVEDFIRFCAEKFIRPSTLKKMKIDVVLDGKFYHQHKCYGMASWTDRPRRPRKFLLEIDTRTPFVFIINCISHEMVHVKQWALGQFYIHEDGRGHTFMRKQYELMNDDDPRYWEVPWEIEAYGRSIGLMQLWVMARHYEKEDWYADEIWETEQRVERIDKSAKR
jgi:hypothetical protein